MEEEKTVIIHTNRGDITIELDLEKAPLTCENFLNYAKTGFYNETIFHRVIKGFMVQGGGFDSDMKYKATNDPIQNEASNGLSNERGSIAMARTSAPHSASSQFFINLVDNDFLDHRDKSSQGWGYAVFGKVTNGLDIVDDIANVETHSKDGHNDVPVDVITITGTTIK
ncbi:MAG: peptidylprolyl isomerase [Pseudomonadota bacterium]|nr:peptidylprolyl isomerase [Pseudomonadota bacterium]